MASKEALRRKRQKYLAKFIPAATALLAEFCQRWPGAFKSEGETPVPLKIGVHLDIARELGGEVRSVALHRAFSIYIYRRSYQEALARDDSVRVDLSGQIVGLVTDEERLRARERLTMKKPKAKAKAAAAPQNQPQGTTDKAAIPKVAAKAKGQKPKVVKEARREKPARRVSK